MRQHCIFQAVVACAGSMLAGLALPAVAAQTVSQTNVAGPAVPTARSIVALADGWRFRQDNELAGAQAPGFADDGWERVSVPHTWNRAGYYIDGAQGHINTAGNVNKAQGVGWYRLAFDRPVLAKGQRVWLEFDAASRTAQVWLNGLLLGRHDGGFSRFRFDVTAALKAGRNILAARVDNSQPTAGGPTADILPLTGDFFVHGGLYRPVRMVVTSAVHVDLADHGGPGVYATTTAVANGTASVAVRTRLTNDGKGSATLRLVTRLRDAAGVEVASALQPVTLAAGTTLELPQALTVANPHLWQGTADPYLHVLDVTVEDARGAVLDRLTQPFGIRQVQLDANRGFLLNGQPLRLQGVGLHQDREGKGWALAPADIADDVATIRDMGANTIRLTHYQHGQTIHEMADRTGLILWDEIPLVTGWTLGPNQTGASPALVENARQQLQEMIRQNFNHASVAVWGIANEVDFGPGRPDFLGAGPKVAPDPMPLLQMLNGLAKQMDSSRPTVLATCCEDRGMQQVPLTSQATDAAGANRYFGWYYGKIDELSAHLDALHAKRPNQPLSVSEYGGGGALSQPTDDPLGGPIELAGRNQPEAYQTWLHEKNWAILKSKPWLWGTWLWNSFDFATTVRHEGDSEDINTKGLVSYDRRIRKDGYFFYRANWSNAPTVHITDRRYVDRAYPVSDVKVYSNAPATELMLNGRSLGVRRDCPDRICIWPAVRLAAGVNRLSASGGFASSTVSDSIEWQLAPQAAQAFRIDAGTVIAARAQGRRFGSDAFFSGGEAGTADTPGGRGRRPVLVAIAGSPDRDLLASFREGDFSYRLPLLDGRYRVTLHFVEPRAAKTERLFDVSANGQSLLTRFDIAATAGAPLTAVSQSLPVSVTGGELTLNFRGIIGKALVSAIEVVPASD